MMYTRFDFMTLKPQVTPNEEEKLKRAENKN